MDIKATALDFTPMHERMDTYIEQNILSCCATLVMQGQEIIDYKTFGYMDLESKEPLRADAIYRMYSNTKLVTSVALMMLQEEGYLIWTIRWLNTCRNLMAYRSLT